MKTLGNKEQKMTLIIIHLFILVFDVAATFINYSKGNFLMAVITSACAGGIFISTIWLIKDKIED